MSLDFSFYTLLTRIKECGECPTTWEECEDLIDALSKEQDPNLVRQKGKHPDIILSNATGIEVKMLRGRPNKGINLNSSCPLDNVYYVCMNCIDNRIQHAAIVHGRNFFTPEMDEICTLQQATRSAQNPSVKFRARLMWEIESPFKVYGEGFFIVDHAGGMIKL
jgi:hypothetical protein